MNHEDCGHLDHEFVTHVSSCRTEMFHEPPPSTTNHERGDSPLLTSSSVSARRTIYARQRHKSTPKKRRRSCCHTSVGRWRQLFEDSDAGLRFTAHRNYMHLSRGKCKFSRAIESEVAERLSSEWTYVLVNSGPYGRTSDGRLPSDRRILQNVFRSQPRCFPQYSPQVFRRNCVKYTCPYLMV